MEKFNPDKPEYKKVEDLPVEEQENYINLPDGGFITKEAFETDRQAFNEALALNKKRPFIERMLRKNEEKPENILHQQANRMNYDRGLVPNFVEDPEMEKEVREFEGTIAWWVAHKIYGARPETVEKTRQLVLDFKNSPRGQKLREYLQPYIQKDLPEKYHGKDSERWYVATEFKREI